MDYLGRAKNRLEEAREHYKRMSVHKPVKKFLQSLLLAVELIIKHLKKDQEYESY